MGTVNLSGFERTRFLRAGLGGEGGSITPPEPPTRAEFVGVGTIVYGPSSLSSLTPPLPVNAQPGHLLLIHGAIDNTTGWFGLPAGWTAWFSNSSIVGARWMEVGDTDPIVTRNGTNQEAAIYITAWRNVRTLQLPVGLVSASAGPVTPPNYEVPLGESLIVSWGAYGLGGQINGPVQNGTGWSTRAITKLGGSFTGALGTASKLGTVGSFVGPTWDGSFILDNRTYHVFTIGLQHDVGDFPTIEETVEASGASLTAAIAMPTFTGAAVGKLAIYVLSRENNGVFSVSSGWTLVGGSVNISTVVSGVAVRILDGTANDTLSVSCTGSSGGYAVRGLLIIDHSVSVVTDVKTAAHQQVSISNPPAIDMGSVQRTLLLTAYMTRTNDNGITHLVHAFFERYSTMVDWGTASLKTILSINTKEEVGQNFDPAQFNDAAAGTTWTIGIPAGAPE